MSADESNALKILDYWFTMEFLNQQSLRPQKDAGNAAFKYKNAFAKGLVRKKKSLTDFIQMKPGDTLAALAEQNAQRTGCRHGADLRFLSAGCRRKRVFRRLPKMWTGRTAPGK